MLGGDSAMKPKRNMIRQGCSPEMLEPDSRHKVYMAEFQTRKRRHGKSWEELADNIRLLVDKAFPDLEDGAKEQLSLDRYLALLDKPEVALAVPYENMLI